MTLSILLICPLDTFSLVNLSPNYLLLTLLMSNAVRLSRWQSFQQQLQHFWQRWSADYLQGLQRLHHWTTTTPNLQPGALVLLREDNTTPLQWPTAVVNQRPSWQGWHRSSCHHTYPQGSVSRPIIKICLLPCEGDNP